MTLPASERFERIRLLGQGGMARVWDVRDRTTQQRVAMKEILGDPDAHSVERLRREAESARQLQHPHICRAIDFRIDDVERWIAFELVQGVSLREVIRALCPVSVPLVLVFIDELLAALAHAHAHGVLHRDVKPRNIMVTHDGVLKLLDFGIARRVEDATLTVTGALVGTPAYMSPEQALGERVDERADLFAVGIVLHEMFTGISPYAAPEIAVTLTRIMTQPVPPLVDVAPWAPTALQQLHGALTQHDRDARCPSATAARAMIASAVAAVDPALPGRALADLDRARVEGHAATRNDLLHQADALLHEGCAEGALLRLDALCRFDPEDSDAKRRRNALAAAYNYTFDVEDEDDLRALKQQVGPRTAPVVFRRLADLYRARRRLGDHARWLRRYALAQPRDSLALEQLAALDGHTRRGGHLASLGSASTVRPASSTMGSASMLSPSLQALPSLEASALSSSAITAVVLPPATARATDATTGTAAGDDHRGAGPATLPMRAAAGPRELTPQPAPPGALGTRDLIAGLDEDLAAQSPSPLAPTPPPPPSTAPLSPPSPAPPPPVGVGPVVRSARYASPQGGTGSSPTSPARRVEGGSLIVVPTASSVDDGAADRGRALVLGIVAALVVGATALFAVPVLRSTPDPAAKAPSTTRAPSGAEMVDVAPLLAEARLQWSNGDATGVIQTTTRVLGLTHETFVVDRREATCLRARAHARLRQRDEARADAQRCIDWQVSSNSPEIEEMRAIVGDSGATF